MVVVHCAAAGGVTAYGGRGAGAATWRARILFLRGRAPLSLRTRDPLACLLHWCSPQRACFRRRLLLPV